MIYTSAPLMQDTHSFEIDSPFCCYASSSVSQVTSKITDLEIEKATESPLQLCTASTPELRHNSDSQQVTHNSEVATLGSKCTQGACSRISVSDSPICCTPPSSLSAVSNGDVVCMLMYAIVLCHDPYLWKHAYVLV